MSVLHTLLHPGKALPNTVPKSPFLEREEKRYEVRLRDISKTYYSFTGFDQHGYFSSDIGYLIVDSWFHLFSDYIYQHLAPT